MQIQGIDDTLQVSARVPFDIDTQYKNFLSGKETSPFVGGYLTKVDVTPLIKKEFKLLPDVKLKDKEKPTIEQVTPDSLRYTLNFYFTGKDGVQEYREQLWEIAPDDEKAANKNRMLNQRIAHIFETYMGANTAAEYLNIKKVFGKNEANYKNYFEGIANIFNTAKEGDTPVYLQEGNKIPVRIKLTRNRSNTRNPNEIKMPLGNVIERIIKGATSSTLVLNGDDEFHVIEKPKATATLGNAVSSSGFGPITASKEVGWDDVEENL